MKHIVLISSVLFLLAAAPAQGETAAEQKLVLAKTTSSQRALTEILSARIKAALTGERYTLDESAQEKR